MRTVSRLGRWLSFALCALLLASCGGGDSSSTTLIGGNLNSAGASPPVSYAYVQAGNNMPVTVEAGPSSGFSQTPSANVLFTTVTVCYPGDPSRCTTVDHVQVDTGSVGLRLLASTVQSLNLPHVSPATGYDAWECYQFVIGGIWGVNAVADIGLSSLVASAVPVQLIQDDASAPIQVPSDCSSSANGAILNSAAALGANGILGIGSTTLDCGYNCVNAIYTNYAQYQKCPLGAASVSACSATAMGANLQTYNPVAALPSPYNNGVMIALPAVTGLGASTASGELELGISPSVEAGLNKVNLGVNYLTNLASYLNITTNYKGQLHYDSYLDTGTNAYFFADSSIPQCSGSTWYCNPSAAALSAVLSDGDNPSQNQNSVSFYVGSADALFITTNTAFGNLAGVPPNGSTAFSWGLPFFFGKHVYLSIWQGSGASTIWPWYAWTPV